MFIGDSHDIPGTATLNSRDLKIKTKYPCYRVRKPMLRQHFAAGDVSGIMLALAITLTQNLGSFDGTHLPALVRRAHAIAPHVALQAWDQAYSSERNFLISEELGVVLYVREKRNEQRLNGTWPLMAQEIALLETSDPAAFDEIYRMRSKAEATPSRVKRIVSRSRLRSRKSDPLLLYPPGVSGKNLSDQPESVIADVLAVAEANVGYARLSEAYAIAIIANLERIVVLEQLLDDKMTFAEQRSFGTIRTVKASDLM